MAARKMPPADRVIYVGARYVDRKPDRGWHGRVLAVDVGPDTTWVRVSVLSYTDGCLVMERILPIAELTHADIYPSELVWQAEAKRIREEKRQTATKATPKLVS